LIEEEEEEEQQQQQQQQETNYSSIDFTAHVSY